MRHSILLALLACAVGVQAIPQKRDASPPPQKTAARKIPCKTEENASMCYWTHGRLGFYNGNPSYRIWKVGTTRILGVWSGPNSERIDQLDNEHPEFPANLDRVFEVEYRRNVALKIDTPYLIGPVFGEFEVCPLEPEHSGWMQAVCIESAKDMFVEFSKRGYK